MPPVTIEPRFSSETELLLQSADFSPIRSSFDAERLRAAVDRIDDQSGQDRALVEYAIWTANAIRALDARRLEHPFHKVRPLDRMQFLMMLAHHAVTDRHQAALDQGTAKAAESKRKFGGGGLRGVSRIRPQEALETAIDSLIYVVNDSLTEARSWREESGEGTSPDTIGPEAVYEYFSFASEYRTIFARWHRVILLGAKVNREYANWTIACEPSYGRRAAVGEFRRARQQISEKQQRLRTWDRFGTPKAVVMGVKLPTQRTHSFRADGWIWRFETVSDDQIIDDDAKSERAQVAGAMYTWIAELAEEVFDSVGTTGRGLLEAWLVLRELAQSFNREQGGQDDGTPPPPLVVSVEDVAAHLVGSLKCSDEQAKAYLRHLGNDGRLLSELYGHPLIDFGPGNVLIFVPGLLHADLERVMVRWLRKNLKPARPMKKKAKDQDKVDRYALKGDKFEVFVRSMLIESVDRAELRGWRIQTDAVRFEANETRHGREFDIVMTLGSTLLIGEVKCSSHPSDPKEVEDREKLIAGAVGQVRDQVEWVRRNWAEFRERVSLPLSISIDDHRILPVVVMDGCYGPGFPVDGVPVIDGAELKSFIISGRWDNGKIGTELLNCGRLYSNVIEAEIMLEPFLEQSPLIERYLLACRPRRLPYSGSSGSRERVVYNDWIVDEDRLLGVSDDQLRSIASEFRKRAFAKAASR